MSVLTPYLSWLLWKAAIPVLSLCLLIVVHEFGHFITAKLCGVGVIRFSVGFGPAIVRWMRGETEYRISWIPLGGYVRMVGDVPDSITGQTPSDELVRKEATLYEAEDDKEDLPEQLEAAIKDRSRWFLEKNFWQRSAIVVAGPMFNMFLALVLVFISIYAFGKLEQSSEAVIGAVAVGSPAEDGGLNKGDKIVKIDGVSINSWKELADNIRNSGGKKRKLLVQRDAQFLEMIVHPKLNQIQNMDGSKEEAYLINVRPVLVHNTDISMFESLSSAGIWTKRMTVNMYSGLWALFSGRASPDDLRGPLFILDVAGKRAKSGLEDWLFFLAGLSISLAVLNLLPIPVLDGGHLLFFILEEVIGPISIKKKEIAQSLGVLVLLSLMAFALHNDIRYGDQPAHKKVKTTSTTQGTTGTQATNSKQPQ